MAQAVIGFLKNQYTERDGAEQPLFAGCFGIFGHGCIAGIGQALQQNRDFRYYQIRNEQAMVHAAAGYAKMKNRMQTFACVSLNVARHQQHRYAVDSRAGGAGDHIRGAGAN